MTDSPAMCPACDGEDFAVSTDGNAICVACVTCRARLFTVLPATLEPATRWNAVVYVQDPQRCPDCAGRGYLPDPSAADPRERARQLLTGLPSLAGLLGSTSPKPSCPACQGAGWVDTAHDPLLP